MATTFAETAIRFVADGTSLNSSLAGIERTVGAAAGRMASAVKTSMLALSGAVAAGAATFAVLVKASANAGDELAKLSQRVAINVETLSGYKVAADLAGVSLQDFGTALQLASRNLVEASRGTGAAADAFAALGIRVTDGAGKIKTAEQIKLEVADRFAQMDDGAQKTALAMDIFGKSGAGMIPLLNQGSAAIAAQRKEAELLGVTWTTSQAKLAEEFNDNLTRLWTGLTGFRDLVVQQLLPFLSEAVADLVARMKAFAASGELKAWAIRTAEAIIDGFVSAAKATASLAQAAFVVVDGMRAMMAAVRVVESGFETAVGGMLRALEKLLAGLAWWAELWGDPWSKGLREAETAVRGWADTFSQAGAQAADAAVGWWDAIANGNATAQKLADGADALAEKFRLWAETAKATSAEAGTTIGQNAAKVGQQIFQAAKDQVKGLDEAFKALKARGEASLQEEFDYLQRRAELFRAGSAERIQAEAEAFKFAREMADQLFAHQKAMGLKSLQDEIDRAKQKAAAAKAGSAERMKAEEDVVKKEEELRTKRQNAALGILGEVKERLEAKGYGTGYITAADVQREMGELQAERASKSAEARRFAAGGGMSLEEAIAGYQAAGQLGQAQAQQRELGGVGEILAGGAQVAAGPLTRELGRLGEAITTPDYWETAGTGMTEGIDRALEAGYSALDAGLSKMEARIDNFSTRTGQSIYANIEEYLVRRIMGQLDRN